MLHVGIFSHLQLIAEGGGARTNCGCSPPCAGLALASMSDIAVQCAYFGDDGVVVLATSRMPSSGPARLRRQMHLMRICRKSSRRWRYPSPGLCRPPGAFARQPEGPNVHISGPRPSQTPTDFHEKTPERERKRTKMGAGEGKKSEILGGPAEGGPGEGGPPEGGSRRGSGEGRSSGRGSGGEGRFRERGP